MIILEISRRGPAKSANAENVMGICNSLFKRNIASANLRKKVEISLKKVKNIESIDAICFAE